MATTPILANSCARATTAAEARYRIDVPIAPARGVRVIALDEGAAEVARTAAAQPWVSARFLVCEGVVGDDRLVLRGIGGATAELVDQLFDADVVVMVATEDAGAAAAHAIGKACWERSIMTAGLVIGQDYDAEHAVAALRPHARVLMPSADPADLVELLTALRA